MALGGGNFTTQNKVLPGAYINFVSAASANAELSERGIVTMPLELDWGVEDEVFTVTDEEFQKNSMKLFGYDYTSEKLKGLRDLFLNSRTLHAFRVNAGGKKAENAFAGAKYTGIRGNDLKIVIEKNTEDETKFNVSTCLGSKIVDKQIVAGATALTANDYVIFKGESELVVTASAPLTGGENGTADGASYQTYFEKMECYTFHAIGVVTTDESIIALLTAFTKRLRDDMGIKFQGVAYRNAADYMGMVNVKNKITNENWSEASLVYWVTGAIAGCGVHKSNQNKKYDGEFTVDANYTQSALAEAIKKGEFTLHKVNTEIRVLDDINSMVSVSDTQGDVFKDNQTVRVIDQLANDDALLFNTKYLGVVPNDESGRISLWSDFVKIRRRLQEIRAIENFKDSDVIVEQGDSKKSVVANSAITVINTMSKLYMTNVIA